MSSTDAMGFSVTPVIAINSYGEATITVEYPGMPVLVFGGAEANVFKKVYTVPLGRAFKIDKVRRFIATDRGDIGEFDTEIYSDGGLSVYREAYHKEVPASFQGWEQEATLFHATSVDVVLLARVNAPNTLLSQEAVDKYRQGNRLSALVHYGLILSGKVV